MNKEYSFEDIDNIGWGRWFKFVAFQYNNNDDVIEFLELFDHLWLKTKYEYLNNYQMYKSKIEELYNKLINNEYIDNYLIKLTYNYFIGYAQEKLEIDKYDLKSISSHY